MIKFKISVDLIKLEKKIYYDSGPRYTINFRIYDTSKEMYEDYQSKFKSRLPTYMSEEKQTLGICHKNKKSCTLWLGKDHLGNGIVAHEVLHAVISAIRNIKKTPILNLDIYNTRNEELLCHNFDNIWPMVTDKFYELKLW